jgi:hypothetical protein
MSAAATTQPPSSTAVKLISALVGVVSLLILLQAVTAGIFVRQPGKTTWVHAHQGMAYLAALLALAVVVVAFTTWKGMVGAQMIQREAVALLVAIIIQIGIGAQLGTSGHTGLLAIHIPLALLIFGLALHLSTFVSNLRRSAR